MADQEQILPIFSLRTVLFPGMVLPLNVFEEHYKEMIGECLEAKRPFGVVLRLGGVRREIGCTAEIPKVLLQHEDGRMTILAEGKKRFRIVAHEGERPYPKCRVRFVEDEPSSDDSERIGQSVQETVRLYKEGIWILKPKTFFDINAASKQENFSFSLAPSTIPHLEVRQKILEATREADRLDIVCDYFRRLLPDLKRLGGNGGRPSFVSPT